MCVYDVSVCVQMAFSVHVHNLLNSVYLCRKYETVLLYIVELYLIFWPPKAAPILFLLSLEVSGTSGTMSIYICQQHGGLLGGSRYRCNISVNFVSLLLFSSAKNLLAIRSLFESYLQSFKSLQEFP